MSENMVVGIIGGMGPDATVEFMRRILRRTPASDDSDHFRLLVDCNPKVPSRIAYLLEGGTIDPAPALVAMARGLVDNGATVLVMPCNTAHAFADTVRASVTTPYIDILESAYARLDHGGGKEPRAFGVLGSPALRRVGILEKRAANTRLVPMHPDEAHEALALSIIRSVKSGDTGAEVIARYNQLKRHLASRGASKTLVCCTEFSVLEEIQPRADRATLDTLDALVEALLPDALVARLKARIAARSKV